MITTKYIDSSPILWKYVNNRDHYPFFILGDVVYVTATALKATAQDIKEYILIEIQAKIAAQESKA